MHQGDSVFFWNDEQEFRLKAATQIFGAKKVLVRLTSYIINTSIIFQFCQNKCVQKGKAKATFLANHSCGTCAKLYNILNKFLTHYFLVTILIFREYVVNITALQQGISHIQHCCCDSFCMKEMYL